MMFDDLMKSVHELLDSIQMDHVGTPVGKEFVGGGGGLQSVATIQKSDAVRKQLIGIEKYTMTHHRRGGKYRQLGRGILQTDQPLEDMAELIVYQHEDGSLWFRTPQEIEDGRFLPL